MLDIEESTVVGAAKPSSGGQLAKLRSLFELRPLCKGMQGSRYETTVEA